MIAREISCLGPRGFHRMIYWEWPGPARGRTALCVHGLTRNGRDFDWLARALSRTHRVICPDVVGRGRSGWLNPGEEYGFPVYLSDMAALIARLDVEEIDWVGTSMGGLIGMMMAATPGNAVRRLVINDVGPFIPGSALGPIGTYVGADPSFASRAALEAYLRTVHAPFGQLTDEQWAHFAEHGGRTRTDGALGLAYDPRIADAFKGELGDVNLWPVWDMIKAPILALRGGDSDLLRAEDARMMTTRGPRARLIEFPGIGHAPALMTDDQIGAVRDFLAV